MRVWVCALLAALIACVAAGGSAKWVHPTPDESTPLVFYVHQRNKFTLKATFPSKKDGCTITASQALPGFSQLSVPYRSFSSGRSHVEVDFVWEPPSSFGGFHEDLCFQVDDAGGVHASPSRCITISVPRCQYRVSPGETMGDVASKLETDYLSLWALNVELNNAVLKPNQVIRTGLTYVVHADQTLSSISSLLHAPIQKIRDRNYNLQSVPSRKILPVGIPVCVFPVTCPTST